MKNLFAAFLLFIAGNVGFAQASQEDIQAEMKRMKEQMQEQMAQFRQLMQETFDEDFLNTMPFRDSVIIREFNLGDRLGNVDTEELQSIMKELQTQMQLQFKELNLDEYFRDGFVEPLLPAPEKLEDQPGREQKQDAGPAKKRRSTHSL